MQLILFLKIGNNIWKNPKGIEKPIKHGFCSQRLIPLAEHLINELSSYLKIISTPPLIKNVHGSVGFYIHFMLITFPFFCAPFRTHFQLFCAPFRTYFLVLFALLFGPTFFFCAPFRIVFACAPFRTYFPDLRSFSNLTHFFFNSNLNFLYARPP